MLHDVIWCGDGDKNPIFALHNLWTTPRRTNLSAAQQGCKFFGNLIFPEIFQKFPEILAEAWKL